MKRKSIHYSIGLLLLFAAASPLKFVHADSQVLNGWWIFNLGMTRDQVMEAIEVNDLVPEALDIPYSPEEGRSLFYWREEPNKIRFRLGHLAKSLSSVYTDVQLLFDGKSILSEIRLSPVPPPPSGPYQYATELLKKKHNIYYQKIRSKYGKPNYTNEGSETVGSLKKVFIKSTWLFSAGREISLTTRGYESYDQYGNIKWSSGGAWGVEISYSIGSEAGL